MGNGHHRPTRRPHGTALVYQERLSPRRGTVEPMRVGLLGGLEVIDDDGRDVVVAGPKLRSLLAVLALQPGRVVPADQLIDALWGDGSAGGGAQRSARARIEAAADAGFR